jgi:hypothetical protein
MKFDHARTLVLGSIAVAGCLAGVSAGALEPKPTRGYLVIDTGAAISGGRITTEYAQQRVYKSLPAGRYMANATIEFISDDPDRRVVDCLFTVGPGSVAQPFSGNVGGGPGSIITLPLSIAFVIGSPKDVGIICRADVSGTVFRYLCQVIK